MDWAQTFGLPAATLSGDKLVPKTMVVRQGGLTAAEQKLLKQFSRLRLHATVGKQNARIATVQTADHDIASVIYLRCELVRDGTFREVAGVLHKVFPNPVVLLFEEPGGKAGVSVSLKRKSLAEKGAVVVERTDSVRLFNPTEAAYADYLADIQHAALPQADLLTYVTALCDRTAKAAAISAIGMYPRCKDEDTPQLMALLSHLREAEGKISVLRSRYRDKETTLAESSRLRIELQKAERMRDGIASEIKELCHG
ncbi:MAG: DUF4391 domain-containing protein [Actinomycetaceae bacterium]|nr:DUF4391 domain-containing protein [Actinomycetaceae bacterium]